MMRIEICMVQLCVSLDLKKSGDFIVSKGHGYPLVTII
jgi:hypothetical protein